MNLKLLTHSYFWHDLKWNIRDYFFPQNKWLRKLIGRSYCEPQWIVENVLFATLVNFVEKENGLDSILNEKETAADLKNNYISQEYIDFRRPIRQQVEAAYNYIKIIRPQMEAERECLYPKSIMPISEWLIPIEGSTHKRVLSCEERYGMSYEKAYGPVNDKEKEIKDLDSFYMKVIIDHRESLWT